METLSRLVLSHPTSWATLQDGGEMCSQERENGDVTKVSRQSWLCKNCVRIRREGKRPCRRSCSVGEVRGSEAPSNRRDVTISVSLNFCDSRRLTLSVSLCFACFRWTSVRRFISNYYFLCNKTVLSAAHCDSNRRQKFFRSGSGMSSSFEPQSFPTLHIQFFFSPRFSASLSCDCVLGWVRRTMRPLANCNP